jgi:hypothetical protein
VLHDALRVSDGTREISELDKDRKAKFISMAISVIKLRAANNFLPSFFA